MLTAFFFCCVLNWHKVAIADMAKNIHTHVEATGVVQYVKVELDGDIHIRLCDDKSNCVVAECIPKLPCAKPKVGDVLTIRGISRFDKEANHKWFELHPVLEITYPRGRNK